MEDYHNPPGGYDWEKKEREVVVALAAGNCKGSKALLELYLHAGKAIPAEELYNLENVQKVRHIADNKHDPDENYCRIIDHYITTSSPDCSIELTDRKTVDQVYKELQAIEYHLFQAVDNNDHGRVEDLMRQKEQCLHYLHECLTPTGKIRKTSDTSRKLTLALARDVKYYLDRLAKTDPDLSNYIRDHVKIGKVCYWSELPITRKRMTKIA